MKTIQKYCLWELSKEKRLFEYTEGCFCSWTSGFRSPVDIKHTWKRKVFLCFMKFLGLSWGIKFHYSVMESINVFRCIIYSGMQTEVCRHSENYALISLLINSKTASSWINTVDTIFPQYLVSFNDDKVLKCFSYRLWH